MCGIKEPIWFVDRSTEAEVGFSSFSNFQVDEVRCQVKAAAQPGSRHYFDARILFRRKFPALAKAQSPINVISRDQNPGTIHASALVVLGVRSCGVNIGGTEISEKCCLGH